MTTISTRIPYAIAIALVTIWVTNATASDRLAKQPGFLYVASFNVYKLGGVKERYTNLKDVENPELPLGGNIPKRIRNVARVLSFGDFDLVALQEVRAGAPGRAAVSDLVRVLNDDHGLSYRFIMSDGIGQGLIPEAMAFLYNSDRVQPEAVNDRGLASIIIELDGDFSPPPPRALVQTQWEAGHFDFTLISAHLAWGHHGKREAGYKKIREIFDRPSDWSRDPDVIVLGDFNRLGGTRPTAIEALPYKSERFRVPNIAFFDPTFSTIRQVTEDSISGKDVPDDDPQLLSTTVSDMRHAYDMIMFSSDASEEFPAALHEARYGVDFGIIHFDQPSGVGFQPGADNLEGDCVKLTYSDHRPIWMRFRTDDPSHADD